MENHPIPQDITGFEFKLIGDMTIKQFAYLASGSILAWIAFSLPVTFLIKFPFTFIFLSFGVSFAFFSIEGRPVDTMIINFIKAAFSPTQYIYQKGALAAPSVNFETPNIIKTPERQNKLDQKESNFFKMLSQLLSSPQGGQTYHEEATEKSQPYIVSAHVEGEVKKKEPEHPTETPEEQPQLEVLVEQSSALQQELQKAKEEEKKDQGSNLYEGAHEKVLELEKLLNETQTQKQSLEKEILELRKQLSQQKQEVYAPSVARAEPRETKNVRTIPKEMGKSAGIPIAPEFPNVVSGIIKDPRGNPLPNILVEVKDKDGSPVRAFKTNALGQFSASTALANGGYTIEFEDPNTKNKFDTIAFTADGNIILPIEVISVDTREELRKSLFT